MLLRPLSGSNARSGDHGLAHASFSRQQSFCISDGLFLIAWFIALSLLPNCGIKYPLRRPLKLENMVVQPPELLQIQLTPLTVVQPQNNI